MADAHVVHAPRQGHGARVELGVVMINCRL